VRLDVEREPAERVVPVERAERPLVVAPDDAAAPPAERRERPSAAVPPDDAAAPPAERRERAPAPAVRAVLAPADARDEPAAAVERRERAPAVVPPDGVALADDRRPEPLGVTAVRSLSKSLSRVLLVFCASRRSVRSVFVTSL
jgi:hypothetical protein